MFLETASIAPPFSSGVASFEQDDKALAGVSNPASHRDEFSLHGLDEAFVFFALQPIHRRVSLQQISPAVSRSVTKAKCPSERKAHERQGPRRGGRLQHQAERRSSYGP